MRLEIKLDEMARDIARRAVDEATYEGKTLREWINLIHEYAKRKDDLISREAVLEKIGKLPLTWEYGEAVKDCWNIVTNTPAIDTPPAVPAYWIEDRTDIVCSACGARYESEIAYMRKDANAEVYPMHCPACGKCLDGDPHDSGQ